jgi:hypothetical protein
MTFQWFEVHIPNVEGVKPDDAPAWKYLRDLQKKTQDAAYGEAQVLRSPDGSSRTTVGGGEYILSYKDEHPDYREGLVKTDNCDGIMDVTKFDGVTCKVAEPSGYFTVCGLLLNEEEMKEQDRIFVEVGHDASDDYFKKMATRFDDDIWPGVKAAILNTIIALEPEALQYRVESDIAKVFVIKTQRQDLIDSLATIDHACVDEIPPGVDDAKIREVVTEWGWQP